MSTAWKPGDRVWVNPTTYRNDWVQATVREVDPDGKRGVLVDLDHPIRGLFDCFATHAELKPPAGDDGDAATSPRSTPPAGP
jgi:hypothetical protein